MPRVQLLGADLQETFVQAQIHRAWCHEGPRLLRTLCGTGVGASQGVVAKEKKVSAKPGKYPHDGRGSGNVSYCPT